MSPGWVAASFPTMRVLLATLAFLLLACISLAVWNFQNRPPPSTPRLDASSKTPAPLLGSDKDVPTRLIDTATSAADGVIVLDAQSGRPILGACVFALSAD